MGRKHVEINAECGKRVKKWLERAECTQKQLAERINWQQQNISRVITGNARLTIDRAKEISDKIPDKDGEHVLVDYLLCNIDSMTEKELLHSKFTALYKRADLINELIESLGYTLTYKDILSRDENGEFYIPMVEIKNSVGACRYMREEEYGAFTKKIVDITAGLLLLELDCVKRGGENG